MEDAQKNRSLHTLHYRPGQFDQPSSNGLQFLLPTESVWRTPKRMEALILCITDRVSSISFPAVIDYNFRYRPRQFRSQSCIAELWYTCNFGFSPSSPVTSRARKLSSLRRYHNDARKSRSVFPSVIDRGNEGIRVRPASSPVRVKGFRTRSPSILAG